MQNLNLKTTDYLNFIYSIDENLQNTCTTKIVKTKNEIIFYFIPTNAPEEFECIKKLFRFQKSCCTYEYGCISFDFTSDFKYYLENLNSSLSQ